MPRTVSDETTIDDPALIETVAIAIFEKTQGSWEYATEADREWLRLEAQAAIVTFLKYIEERGRIFSARDGKRQQPLLELILHPAVSVPVEYAVETPIERQLPLVGSNPFLIGQSIPAQEATSEAPTRTPAKGQWRHFWPVRRMSAYRN
jgi:hypothetical protein